MPLSPPFSEEAWLGSDQLGRDVLTGIIHGGRATLMVGAFAALLSVCIGVTLGAMAGYYGGRVDALLMRVTEFFQVLPALLFAMVVVTLFSPSLVTVTLAIGSVSWPATARLTRAEFMRIRQLEFVRAESAIGARHGRIIWKVILPNALPPLVVSATLAVGAAILFEAGLSFLGLGDPNQMSWGLMIGSARQYLLSCWWAVAFPCRHLRHRAGRQPDRRRPQRCTQPQAEGALMDTDTPCCKSAACAWPSRAGAARPRCSTAWISICARARRCAWSANPAAARA